MHEIKKKKSVAILITTFNRKDITISCLSTLSLIIKSLPEYSFDIFLTDDLSTDGTKEEVVRNFPKVKTFSGNGHLYWTRGMINSWDEASKFRMYDYYLWLNDDVSLYRDGLSEALSSMEQIDSSIIICGITKDPRMDAPSYGGKDKNQKLLEPNGTCQDLLYLNGNFVLVPKKIYNKIGGMDGRFWHHGGDYEYGFRALKSGFKVCTSKKYIGECAQHDVFINRTRKMGVSIGGRISALYNSPFVSNPINTLWLNIEYRKLLRKNILKSYAQFVLIHITSILSDKFYLFLRRIVTGNTNDLK